MKTSLIIDDKVFLDAKKEADQSGQSISEVISKWALLGRNYWKKSIKNKPIKKFQPQKLGPTQVDLTQRSVWMDALDDGDL